MDSYINGFVLYVVLIQLHSRMQCAVIKLCYIVSHPSTRVYKDWGSWKQRLYKTISVQCVTSEPPFLNKFFDAPTFYLKKMLTQPVYSRKHLLYPKITRVYNKNCLFLFACRVHLECGFRLIVLYLSTTTHQKIVFEPHESPPRLTSQYTCPFKFLYVVDLFKNPIIKSTHYLSQSCFIDSSNELQ